MVTLVSATLVESTTLRWPGMIQNSTFALMIVAIIGIIAAIALTLRGRKDSRKQDASQQVRVKKADRLKIVKIDPVTTRGAAETEVKEAP